MTDAIPSNADAVRPATAGTEGRPEHVPTGQKWNLPPHVPDENEKVVTNGYVIVENTFDIHK